MSASPKPPAIFSSSASKRGEIAEWREALNNNQENVRKDAVKKIIAAMTVGKDVSSLFSDVVKCVQTNNIELKKLVYLYIMNYAKVEPDLAILAVSTFDSDSKHPNPLIRGLAVRTMGCIRVNKIIEYLAEPLRRSLKDKDPYVRKTAAVAIAKLFDLNSELAIEQGFVESLEELLTDENPMVVANAVATLSEISSTSPEVNVEFNEKTVKTLLAALNECTEWGQVFILDALANYDAKSENEANQIADRVVPRLAHSNSAVVLSACKVIIKTLSSIQNPAAAKQLSKKMAGPLVTLLNSEPEIQYVALRNIDLIVQKLPGVLEKDVKVFFCKYNDPIYVKLEKLEIMIKLVSERNIDTVLNEFKEYATEVDVEFVRKSVRAIGRCAIKLEKAAQRCINTLLELIETKVNYVVQEAIIVIKDIFRKYPNKYEMIIGTLCQNLDTLDEPEAKAAMIWIIGEYADRIENADELIELFTDAFHDESTQVQLQILTSTVKLFLQRPNEGQKVVQKVLKMATEESDNPDLRDRGYMYWRLLSSNAQAAKAIILAEKPVISDDSTNLPKQLLDDLIPHIATLASVYHKPPELFVPEYRKKRSTKPAIERQDREEERDEDIIQIEHQDEEVPEGAGADVPQGGLDSLDDLLGMGTSPAATTTRPAPAPAASSVDDLLGFGTPAPVQPRSQAPQVRRTVVLPAAKGNGLEIAGAVVRRNGQVLYDMVLSNASGEPITGIAAKFNVNTFGIAPGGPFSVSAVNPGQQVESTLPLSAGIQAQYSPDKISNVLQVAIRANGKVAYFQDKLNVTALFEEDGKMQSKVFLGTWQQIPEEQERTIAVQLSTANPEAITAKLEARNIFYIAKHNVDQNQTNYYYSAKISYKGEAVNFLFELVLNKGSTSSQLCTKTTQVQLVPLLEEDIKQILSE